MCLSILTLPFAGDVTDKNNTVNANVSVDIGKNAAGLIDKGTTALAGLVDKGGTALIATFGQIASKLGTTMEQILTIYSNQVRIEGMTNLIGWGAFIIFLWILSIVFWCNFFPKFKQKTNDYGTQQWHVWLGVAAATTGVALLATAVYLGSAPDMLTMAFNPQYEAIQRLVHDASNLVSSLK